MARARILFLARFLIAFLLLFGLAVNSSSQSKRHIKVLLETKQFVTSNQETLGGSGSIVIRRGAVNPTGSIVGNDRQTNVQITRQILGSQSQPRSSEINLVVTATIQNLN